MSAVNTADPPAKSASKKKRKNKKKASDKNKANSEPAEANGGQDEAEADPEDGEGDDDETETARKESITETPTEDKPAADIPSQDTAPEAAPAPEPASAPAAEPEPESAPEPKQTLPLRNGVHKSEQSTKDEDTQAVKEEQVDTETSARLDAMAKERDDLKAEVAESRKSSESIQEKHNEDLSGLKDEVEQAESAKETAETQYRTLSGKVNTIRSQLGERLKADAEESSQARAQIEELQEENSKAKEETRALREAHDETVSRLTTEVREQAEEIDSLRSRTNLSQSNWAKERDDMVSQLAFAREEFENAKQAMQDWEVLAMEERSLRENLSDKVAELEDQLNAQRDAYERAASERDSQSQTVDGSQRASQEIQDARKRELREMVENSQAQLEEMRKQAEEARQAATEAQASLEATQKELERASPFEKEVKEKNSLIGKLRHEAVILNDHLTKALRFLKRGKPEDNVDRQIVTNHFLHFLASDRSDPKKFQVLQLIAALLGWTEEQREKAGLARPGTSNSALRVPMSPFRRTPSTPSLSTDFMPDGPAGGASRESLAELWSDFLAREAEAGGEGSRRGSVNIRSSSVTSPSVTSPTSERNFSGSGIKGSGNNNQSG